MQSTRRDVFLLPGGLAFGRSDLHLRTLLGSCVSVVVWHPALRLGGMCHFLLARRSITREDDTPDGRYATDALDLLLMQMSRAVTHVDQFVAHVCGGANCLSGIPLSRGTPMDIGRANIAAAEAWCAEHQLVVQQRFVAGDVYRHVAFDNATGVLSVREGRSDEYQIQGKKA